MKGKIWIANASLICSILALSPASADDFQYRSPPSSAHFMKLYATRYYVHNIASSTASDAVSLLRRDGRSLGISVPQSEFCFGALQGTMAINNGSQTVVYNVDGLAPKQSAICSYRKLSAQVNDGLGRQAWAPVTGNGNYGLGVHGFRLVPFRTIAVDSKLIPYGTVLYIPALKGFKFDDNGTTRTHDGYVFAGDTGGGIKGNHVDLFTGNYTGAPPAFVTSRADGLFDAQVVTDPEIVGPMTSDARYKP